MFENVSEGFRIFQNVLELLATTRGREIRN